MCRLCIQKLEPGAPAPKEIAGVQTTIQLPDVPAHVKTWQDFVNWLKENPNIITLIISAILMLLGGIAPPQKAA